MSVEGGGNVWGYTSEGETEERKEVVPDLPEGLSAVAVPELGNFAGRYHLPHPVSENVALERFNDFLAQLNEQGVKIVGSHLETVINNCAGKETVKQFLIVEKPKQAITTVFTPDPLPLIH